MITVLFSSAGRRTELLNCFRKDAVWLGESLRVLAVDVQPEFSSACHGADASFKTPHCLDEEFVPRLLDICRNENVKLLVPTIDTELEVLADAQQEFEAIGTRVHISSSEVVRTAPRQSSDGPIPGPARESRFHAPELFRPRSARPKPGAGR